MLSKKLLTVLIVVIVVLLALAVWLTVKFVHPAKVAESPYSAVYLATGDIYFGKLSWFPQPHLKQVWILQRTVDKDNQPQLGVAPFAGAFWGPMDEVYLNPKQIVFWTKLRADSQVAQALENPAALNAAQQNQQPAQPPTNQTSTFKGPSGQPPGK
jgi:hypothetical protein